MIKERFTLTIKEASQYYHIGQNKLRRLIHENEDADYILWNGSRALIKCQKFEDFINEANVI